MYAALQTIAGGGLDFNIKIDMQAQRLSNFLYRSPCYVQFIVPSTKNFLGHASGV